MKIIDISKCNEDVINYINELQDKYAELEKLNKELDKSNITIFEENDYLIKENRRLNSIINEFDKWLDEESEKTILSTGHLTCLMMCKNELQELKGSGSNEIV